MEKVTETTAAPEQPKPITQVRPRGTYNPRSRKLRLTSPTAAVTSTARPTAYKFNRKLKTGTTELPSTEFIIKPRQLESSNLVQKSRPAYFSRRNKTTSGTEANMADNDKNESNIFVVTPSKASLPKTSYYSRFRNKSRNDISTSTTEPVSVTTEVEKPAESKMEHSVDMPLIFSLLKNPTPTDSDREATIHGLHEQKEPVKGKKMFIIAVTSKESQEQSTENEVSRRSEEILNKVTSDEILTSKFHATSKNHTAINESESKDNVPLEETPAIRNIQTRKYSRSRPATKPNEEASVVTPIPRERYLRKFSDSYSKTTEPSTNGVSNFKIKTGYY